MDTRLIRQPGNRVSMRHTRSAWPRKSIAKSLAAALLFALPLGGCFSETFQKGYLVPEGALEQLPVGASQDQVLTVIVTPSTVATASGEAFYYLSQPPEPPIPLL